MHNEGRNRSFRSSAAIADYLRVKLNGSGKLALAGATDSDIGVTHTASFAADESQGVVMRSAQGTQYATASAAIAVGAELGPAASGKVVTGTGWGIALQAATADGDVIEVVRF